MAHFGAHAARCRLAVLAAILVLSVGAQGCDQADHKANAAKTAPPVQPASPAQSNDGPPTKNGVYIAEGICFGEGGCPWKHWRAYEPVKVHEQLDAASPIIATVAAGEWIEPVEGQLRLVPQRGVVRTAHDGLTASLDGRTVTPRLEVGDVVYLLEPMGEGEFVMWRGGKSIYWRWPDNPEDEAFIAWDPPAAAAPTLGWWVRVRLKNGRSGWVKEPRFECMGPLGGDENCRG